MLHAHALPITAPSEPRPERAGAGPTDRGGGSAGGSLGIPTLTPEASPCPGHARASHGLSSAPQPLPQSRLERVLGWAGSPACSASSVPGAAVCRQAREADNRPGGVRKGPRSAEGEAGRKTLALQTSHPGPQHGSHSRAGPGATRSPRVSHMAPCAHGGRGRLPALPAGFQSHSICCALGTGAPRQWGQRTLIMGAWGLSTAYYGLYCVHPTPKFRCEALTPRGTVFGDGALRR